MSTISAIAGNLLNDIAMIKRAYKQADDSRGEQEASKLINNSPLAPVLDFYGTPWGMARAGRATTLGNAMGQDVDYSVSNPLKSDMLHALGGGAIGALGGAALGGLSGHRVWQPYSSGLHIGALLGGGLGAVTGSLYNGFKRMHNVGKIRRDYVDAVNSKKKLNLDAADPKLTALGGLMGFMGGQHRGGAADAYNHLTGGSAEQSGLREIGRFPTPFAALAAMGEGIGAANTIEEANRRRGKIS